MKQSDYPFSRYNKCRDEANRIADQMWQIDEPNSPYGTHRMVQISKEFLMSANTRDMDMLLDMFDAPGLYISNRKDAKGLWVFLPAKASKWDILRHVSTAKANRVG